RRAALFDIDPAFLQVHAFDLPNLDATWRFELVVVPNAGFLDRERIAMDGFVVRASNLRYKLQLREGRTLVKQFFIGKLDQTKVLPPRRLIFTAVRSEERRVGKE